MVQAGARGKGLRGKVNRELECQTRPLGVIGVKVNRGLECQTRPLGVIGVKVNREI